ncbi:MAG: thiamine pyrophosphate-binding protein [Pseudomonadota bacterium]
MNQSKKHAGAVLVDCLRAQNVRRIFAVPGESYLAALDGLHDANDVELVLTRHEGGAAFMAEAHGKLTGQPGIAMVTRGPGATNASIGVHTAMQDSSPMILFVGQIATWMRDREAFQEIDYRAFFGPIAKWAVEVDDAARLPEIVSRAFSVAQSGRPGPVVVALPEDMLSGFCDAGAGAEVRVSRPAPDAAAVDEAVDLLSQAQRPLVLAGGGGWDDAARADLKMFAERNGLPVACVFRFQDLMDNHSDCYVGDAGVGMAPHMKRLLAEADVILALGPRFGEATTDGYTLFQAPDPVQSLIHVHASDAELGKIYQAKLPIHAHPGAFLRAVSDVTLPGSDARATWTAEGRSGYLATHDLPPQPGALDMGAVMRHMQGVLPQDAILTNGAGNFAIWPNKLFKFGPNQRLLGPQSGAMGSGVPAAVAAKAEFRDRTVVCFAGDGDFQMTGMELGAALQAGCQPIVLILNNGMYGTIRMHQEREYPHRVAGTQIANPDFVQLAMSFGYHAERVERTEEFADAFARAQASANGAVLELMIDPEAITPGRTMAQIRGS